MTMELKVILPIALGALGIGVAIWQFLKSQKVQKKYLENESQDLELKQKSLEFERLYQAQQKKNLELEAKNQEQHKKNQELEIRNQAQHKKSQDLEAKNQELQKKSKVFEAQNQELQLKIRTCQEEFELKNLELQKLKFNHQQEGDAAKKLVQTIVEDVQDLPVSSSDEEVIEQIPDAIPDKDQPVETDLPPLFIEKLEAGDLYFFKSLNITGPWLEKTAPEVEKRLGAGSFTDILLKVCADAARDLKVKRPVILRYLIDQDKLNFDKPTVLSLLNFNLDMDNPQNQALELEAFSLLKTKGPKKLKKFLNDITAKPPRKISSLNSVYVSEYLA